MMPNVPDSPHQRFQPTRIVFGTCHKNISLNTGDTIHSVLMIISCGEMEKSLPTCMSNTFQLPYHRGAAEQILVEVPSRNTESGELEIGKGWFRQLWPVDPIMKHAVCVFRVLLDDIWGSVL